MQSERRWGVGIGEYALRTSLKLFIRFLVSFRLLAILPFYFRAPKSLLNSSCSWNQVKSELGLSLHAAINWLLGWQSPEMIYETTTGIGFYFALLILMLLLYPSLVELLLRALKNLLLHTISALYRIARWVFQTGSSPLSFNRMRTALEAFVAWCARMSGKMGE